MKKFLLLLLVLFVLFNNSLTATPDTDLLDSAKNGDLSKAEAALKGGADVNATDYGRTALMEASERGHLEIVKLLIANKADVNAMNKYDGTALMMASRHLEIVKWLIANNADVNAKTDNGWTALMMASRYGYLETVQWLVANKADVNYKKNTIGWTALMWASLGGHLEIVKLLIANKADVNANDGGWTALMAACYKGSLETVKWLIVNKADVNAKTNDGWTAALLQAPDYGHLGNNKYSFTASGKYDEKIIGNDGKTALIWASEYGHLETVKWLLANNADVNAKPKDGWTALITASKNGHLEIVKLLIANKADVNAKPKDGRTALITASVHGHLEIVKLLIVNKADVNAKTENRDTALGMAYDQGHLEIVKLLIANNADVNFKNNKGETALLFASQKGHLEIVKLLIANKADVNAKNISGWTALMSASGRGHLEIVKWLITNNADVNAKANNGMTAFMSASERGHLDIAKLLIENNADVNAKSDYGKTALMSASTQGYLETVKWLITNKADVNAKSEYGHTALMSASEIGHLEIVKWLITNKADVNAKSDDGKTALMVASKYGHLEIVKLLIANKADVNAKNNKGETALQLAQANKYYPVVEYLKQQETLLAKTKYIKNPTGEKIKLSEWEKIQSTLEPLVFKKDYTKLETYFKNKNPNSYSESGESYLHAAMRLGDAKFTELLLKKGAKPENLDNDGNSSLHIAAEKGQTNLIPLLTKNKNLGSLKNAEGKNALALALENNKGLTSTLLLKQEKEEGTQFPNHYEKFFTNLNLSFHLQGQERVEFQSALLQKYSELQKKSKTNQKEISSILWFLFQIKKDLAKAKELEKNLDKSIPLVSIFSKVFSEYSAFTEVRVKLFEIGANYYKLQNKTYEEEVFRIQLANRKYPLTAKETPSASKKNPVKKQSLNFPKEFPFLDLVSQSISSETIEENPLQLVVQSFHTDIPSQISFSSDGQFFLTSSEDKTVKLFSESNAKVLREYEAHDEAVNAVSIHPDGLHFISGSADGVLKIWEITDISPKKPILIFKSPITSLSFDPTGKYFVAGSAEGEIKVFPFDYDLDEPVFELNKHSARINSLYWSQDSTQLLSASADKVAYLWDLDFKNKSGKNTTSFSNHGASVTRAIFHPKKEWVITASEDHNINIFTKDGKVFKTLRKHTGSVTDITLSADGLKLYSSSADKSIRSWNLENFLTEELPNVTHSRRITGIALQPTTSSIYSISEDKSIGIWNANTFHKRTSPSSPLLFSTVSQNEEWLAATSLAGDAKLWRIKAGNDLKFYSYPNHVADKNAIAFSSDNQIFAFISKENKIEFHSLPVEVQEDPKFLGSISIPEKNIKNLQFSEDNKYLFAIVNENKIAIWDTKKNPTKPSQEIVPDFITPESSSRITTYSVSKDNIILTANKDGLLETYDSSGKSILSPKKSGHKKEITSIAFSSIGNTFATGSLDISENKKYNTLKVWELTKSEIKSKETLTETFPIESISFSPNGEEIAVGQSNSVLKIWNLKDNIGYAFSKNQHTNLVNASHYSKDGSRIYTSSKDGSLKIWNGKTKENICTIYPFPTSSLAINKSGSFDYSHPEAKQFGYFIRKLSPFAPTQLSDLEKTHRKPALVKFTLEDSYITNTQKIQIAKTTIRLKSPDKNLTVAEKESIDLRFKLNTVSNENVERVEVFVNNTKRVTLHNPNFIKSNMEGFAEFDPEQEIVAKIPIEPGQNRVKIAVSIQDRLPETKQFTINMKPKDLTKIPKGDLHILAIGVNEYSKTPLQNAGSDANSALLEIKKIATASNLYGEIHEILLTKKEETTKDKIIQNFNKLKKTKIQDTVIIFYSGHGQKTVDNLYYLLPSDFPWDRDSTQAETGRDYGIHAKLISKLFEEIQAAKVVLILDSCYSGTIQAEFKSATTDKNAFEDMANSSGRFLLASSAGSETSIEDRDKIKQGLFTYVFLNALGKRVSEGILDADSVSGNKDAFLDMNEIGFYISSKFKEQIVEVKKKNDNVAKIDYIQTPTSLISSGRYDSTEPAKVFPLGKVGK
ncbi:MAG: ankyrin repeat domain-containing protein [Leptospiraceae bacterium]|nr:ankyrin repeat domain-containing protein [Leptospiraceae bacterium]